MNKKELHVVAGMTKDMSASQFSKEYVYDARNIRITARDSNPTLLSVTNERGTSQLNLSGDLMSGVVIGTAAFKDFLVVFTTNDTDSSEHYGNDGIYRIDIDNSGNGVVHTLFLGDLSLDAQHPLETLPLYETGSIQKVYWIDGKNQPRVINVQSARQYNPDKFNFVRLVAPGATIYAEKQNGGGEFPTGMIQYCFAYFDKFGQETSIVDTSEMYFLSPQDRGLPADATTGCSFKLLLTGLDNKFKYVRIYSIISTSENSVQNTRIVGDYEIQKTVSINSETLSEETLVIVPDTSAHYGIGPFEDLCVKSIVENELLYKISDVFDSLSDGPDWGGVINLKEYIPQIDTRLFKSPDDTDPILVTEKESASPYTVVTPDCWEEPLLIAKRNDAYYVLSPEVDEQAPVVRVLTTAELNEVKTDSITVVDNGQIGSAVDNNLLLYLGGNKIIPQTMATKDNTLFFGNIEEYQRILGNITVGSTELSKYARSFLVQSYRTRRGLPDVIDNNRSASQIKSFKSGENYRLGFIAQDENGKWSDAVWLGDYTETLRPEVMRFETDNGKQKAGVTNVGFQASIPANVVSELLSNGYASVAPVVVFPSDCDRIVICQGILSGTVFNVKDRADNSPYAQADWRFRDGYSWKRIEKEIQLNSWDEWVQYEGKSRSVPVENFEAPTFPALEMLGLPEGFSFTEAYGEYFYRDPTILTFHSPDIEQTDSIRESDFENTSLYIVGVSNGGYLQDGQTIEELPPKKDVAITLAQGTAGFLSWSGITSELKNDNYDLWGNDKDYLKFMGFIDAPVYATKDGDTVDWICSFFNRAYKWSTYLWHRHGTLNNYSEVEKDIITPPGKLKRKCISELSHAYTTFFEGCSNDVKVSIGAPKLYSMPSSMVSFSYPNSDKRVYYGDIDKVLGVSIANNANVSGTNTAYALSENIVGKNKTVGYPVLAAGNGSIIDNNSSNSVTIDDVTYNNIPWDLYNKLMCGWLSGVDSAHAKGVGSKDPVYMKYKTVKHLIIPLTINDYTVGSLGESTVTNDNSMFWGVQAHSTTFEKVLLTADSFPDHRVWPTAHSNFVADLRRNFSSEDMESRFGGTSKEALAMNDWKVCGGTVKLYADHEATITFSEGDTYVGRYDFLKAYPYTPEDENSIVSIYSTQVESRVNLDLRYDTNRNLKDNTLVTPQNFNLFNRPGYEQTNRFFTYHSLDYDRFKSLHHPNMLTWSLEKTLGEDVDTWTSVSLMSTADLQGDLGEITALSAFNDNIFAFQTHGLAQVLYNSRVQIPTSDGQPIEITNGLKYGGLRYLSKTIGLSNKWSLYTTDYAMYFLDDSSSSLFRFSQQLEDLSTTKGFNTWTSSVASHKVWNPIDYQNIRTFYDKTNRDLYFTGKDSALVFSEQLDRFTSFVDYGSVSSLINVRNSFIAFTYDDTPKAWKLWGGEYNMFFGEYKPYWITFVSNDGQVTDKVFNNLEWRSYDYFTPEEEGGVLQPFTTFDTVRVWNDHQDTGNVSFVSEGGRAYNLKKKFNVFRALVPRDQMSLFAPAGRDRIRSPWAYIQLSRLEENTDYFIFNDLIVDYFE